VRIPDIKYTFWVFSEVFYFIEINKGQYNRGSYSLNIFFSYRKVFSNGEALTQLINRIQGCFIFSKFDCKSGFWLVKMHPDSIEWTTFTCPQGHYEWLVMSFGFKNAPSVFQRKIDDIFRKHSEFVLVNIDDILVFSKNKQDHIGHLQVVFA